MRLKEKKIHLGKVSQAKKPKLSARRLETLNLLVSNQLKLKKILFDIVITYRMLTWGVSSDLEIRIEPMFNQQLWSNLEARILKHSNLLVAQTVEVPELVACMKILVKELTRDRTKNNVWFSQLLVSIYRNYSKKEYFTHRPPIEILNTEHILLLSANYRLNKSNLKNTFRENIDRQSQDHSIHNRQIINMIFDSRPQEADELLYYTSFPLSTTLGLIIVLLLTAWVFSVLDKNGLSCPLLIKLSIAASLILFFFLKMNTIESKLVGLQSLLGFKLQSSYFTFDNLPALFQQNLLQDLTDLIDPSKENHAEYVSPRQRSQTFSQQREIKPIKQAVIAPILIASSCPAVENEHKEKKPIVDQDPDLLTRERRQRTLKYIASQPSIPRAPTEIEEVVIWKKVLDLSKKNSYISELAWRVNEVGHKQLFRLWSTCANRFDHYQSYCVFFNPPLINPQLEQAFRMTASIGRVVGRKDEAGFVKLAPTSEDINDFPKLKDSKGQERSPQFKIKTMHKLFAAERMPVYVYEEKVKSNKGNEFVLCLTGASYNSK